MNGFSDHGLDEGSFGEKGGIVKAFDAFRMFYSFACVLFCMRSYIGLQLYLIARSF